MIVLGILLSKRLVDCATFRRESGLSTLRFDAAVEYRKEQVELKRSELADAEARLLYVELGGAL